MSLHETDLLSDPASDPGGVPVPEGRILASMTDKRGVIGFANDAFCQIAGYDRDDLIGAPQKIVRHPDMPRGLFHLFWARLSAGLPVCAYIKNRCKDDRFYWVFALAMPIPDGYVSVRIRPQARTLDTAKDIYARVLAAEQQDADPAQGAALLQQGVALAGYPDYADFMLSALTRECGLRSARDAGSGDLAHAVARLSRLIADSEALVQQIGKGFEQIRGEPINMRILAGRLEEAGAAIATISQNYELMAREMHQSLENLREPRSERPGQLAAATQTSRFSLLAAALIKDAVAQSTAGGPGTGDDRGAAPRELIALADQTELAGGQALNAIQQHCRDIPRNCADMRRRINGLDVVKLLCRVESGRIGRADQGLNGIIGRLEQFHLRTDKLIGDLMARSRDISALAASLRKS